MAASSEVGDEVDERGENPEELSTPELQAVMISTMKKRKMKIPKMNVLG